MKIQSTKDLFNVLSYLSYPLMLVSVIYILRPIFVGNRDALLTDFNSALVFLGLGISFSTLQDTTKTQNNFSLRIYQSRTKSKIFFGLIGFTILLFISMGLYAMLTTERTKLKELAFGMIVLGMGIIGMLKAAMEMGEYHLAEFEAKQDFVENHSADEQKLGVVDEDTESD